MNSLKSTAIALAMLAGFSSFAAIPKGEMIKGDCVNSTKDSRFDNKKGAQVLAARLTVGDTPVKEPKAAPRSSTVSR